MKYKKGTQAMLDEAKDDATLLPYKKVFKTKKLVGSMPKGTKVVRGALDDEDLVGDKNGVAFEAIDGSNYNYYCADDLTVCKPNKWQNGTQAQLDAAKDDARLIPKKTYFYGPYSLVYHCADACDNSKEQVLMIALGSNGVICSGYFSSGDLHAN